jgi:glycosyltransferase involved in cell wall biosynthesis
MKHEPIVSIVTPSFNCSQYIEENIRCIQDQDYPQIEHIVVDGGSKDNTVDILKKYGGSIKWISEPDKGMYDAINKGIAMSRGEILTYINADDLYYAKNTVSLVVQEFEKHPDVDFIYGDCSFIDDAGKELYLFKAPPFNREFALAFPRTIFQQPTCLWRKRVHIEFDSSLKHCGDAHFFHHLIKNHQGRNMKQVIAKFRVRGDSISFNSLEKYLREGEDVDRIRLATAGGPPSLRLRIYDLFYYKAFLNWRGNIKRFILKCQKRPYW